MNALRQADMFGKPGARYGNQSQPAPALQLRDYQAETRRDVYRLIASGQRRVCVVAAVAFGKTKLAAQFVIDARSKGRRVAFCVPMLALIDQTVDSFESSGIDHIGVIQADHPRMDESAPVQVCSVQTLAKRGVPEGIDVVIVDEAHVSSTAIRSWMVAQPDTIFIGLTATPGRADMSDEYGAIIEGKPMSRLIEDGSLSDYRVFAPSAPDMSKARTVAGDYNKRDMADAMDDPELHADIVQTWLERGEGLPTFLFAVNRAHAKRLQSDFKEAGVECAYQDAHTDSVERKFIARQFAAGKFQIVANVGTLIAGVDWDVRCIIMARPSKSRMFHVQSIGRGLRTAAGKHYLRLFDHAGNVERMGFPDQLDWSAFPEKGAKKAKAEKREPMPKACQECSFVMPPKSRVCPQCQHEAAPPSGFIETVDGDLVEVDREGNVIVQKAVAPTKEDKQAWWSSILHEQRRMGKAKGWAGHTYRDKMGVFPSGLSDVTIKPLPEVLAFIRAKNIRYAKSMESKRGAGK